MKLFDRKIAVVIESEVGNKDVVIMPDTVRISFTVSKTPLSSPNKLNVVIYNLKPDTRKKIKKTGVIVTVLASYKDECVDSNGNIDIDKMKIVSRSDVVSIRHIRSGVNFETRINGVEGYYAYRASFVNESLSPGVKIQDVFDKLVQSFAPTQIDDSGSLINRGFGIYSEVDNVIISNIAEAKSSKLSKLLKVYNTEFINGVTLSGLTFEILDELTLRHNLIWFLDNNILYILQEDGSIENEPLTINKNNGLIGSPVLGENGVLDFNNLLDTRLSIWSIQNLDTDIYSGFYKIGSVTMVGDNYSNNYYSSCKAIQVL
jgi:hypothetical protein